LIRTRPLCFIFFLLYLFVFINNSNSWINITPSAYAQLGTCNSPFVKLIIQKQFSIANSNPLPPSKINIINNNVSLGTVNISQNSVITSCLSPGTYEVTEQQISGVASLRSSTCSGTVLASSSPITCTIINTDTTNTPSTGFNGILNQILNGTTSAPAVSSIQGPGSSIITKQTGGSVVTQQTGASLLTTQDAPLPLVIPGGIGTIPSFTIPGAGPPNDPTSLGAGTANRATNPPFKPCQSNQLVDVGTQQNPDVKIVAPRQYPSSATYVIVGSLPLDKIKNAMLSLGTDKFTIQLLSNIQPSDFGIKLAASNPQFIGRAIIEDNNGLHQKFVNFAINDVRTQCKYITLAEEKSQGLNQGGLVPLGLIGQNHQLKAVDKNELLINNGTFLKNAQDIKLPSIINPPFAVCPTPQTALTNTFPDDIAIYNIRGEVNSPAEVFGKTLNIEITADLVQSANDLAQITNNNNQFVKVNLIADKGNGNKVHLIGFTLNDLWTDCKDVDLSKSSIFEPVIGENNF